MPTTERLARALEQALCPADMVARARAGYYDDFKSELALPLATLAHDLRALGQHDLAARAMSGEFDATREEADAWASSPEGRAALMEMLKRPSPGRER